MSITNERKQEVIGEYRNHDSDTGSARVGRGAEQSYCILLSSFKLSSEGRERINTMVRTNNGFEIAVSPLGNLAFPPAELGSVDLRRRIGYCHPGHCFSTDC